MKGLCYQKLQFWLKNCNKSPRGHCMLSLHPTLLFGCQTKPNREAVEIISAYQTSLAEL